MELPLDGLGAAICAECGGLELGSLIVLDGGSHGYTGCPFYFSPNSGAVLAFKTVYGLGPGYPRDAFADIFQPPFQGSVEWTLLQVLPLSHSRDGGERVSLLHSGTTNPHGF